MSPKQTRLRARAFLSCLLLALLIVPGTTLALDAPERSPQTETAARALSPLQWAASLAERFARWLGLTAWSGAAYESCTSPECQTGQNGPAGYGGGAQPTGGTGGGETTEGGDDGDGDTGGHLDPWG